MAPPKVVITIERGNRKVFVDGREYGPGLHRPNITFKDPDLPSLKIGPGANPLTVTGWGLRTLSMLYLSRSLEAGGDSAASARALNVFSDLWRGRPDGPGDPARR